MKDWRDHEARMIRLALWMSRTGRVPRLGSTVTLRRLGYLADLTANFLEPPAPVRAALDQQARDLHQLTMPGMDSPDLVDLDSHVVPGSRVNHARTCHDGLARLWGFRSGLSVARLRSESRGL